MNYSKQREALLGYLRSTKSHPTAGDIYAEMRKSDPKISLGTVYRNLSLLLANGTIKRVDTDHDSVHYDGDISPHYHFVCDKCGTVFDTSVNQLDLDKEVEKQLGCDITGHSLIFHGICKNCKGL